MGQGDIMWILIFAMSVTIIHSRSRDIYSEYMGKTAGPTLIQTWTITPFIA